MFGCGQNDDGQLGQGKNFRYVDSEEEVEENDEKIEVSVEKLEIKEEKEEKEDK